MSLVNKIKILILSSTISAFLVFLVYFWIRPGTWGVYAVIPFVYIMAPTYLIGLITTLVITFVKIKDSTGSKLLFSIASLLSYFVVFYLLYLLSTKLIQIF